MRRVTIDGCVLRGGERGAGMVELINLRNALRICRVWDTRAIMYYVLGWKTLLGDFSSEEFSALLII